MNVKTAVFCDVDGILLNSEGKITPLTLRAIHRLSRNDIPFVIVTGRCPMAVLPILSEYSLKIPVIAYGGALIQDRSRHTLYHTGMRKSIVASILSFLGSQSFDISIGVYSFNDWIVQNRKDPRIKKEEKATHACAREGSLNDIELDCVHKVLCMCNPEQTVQLERLLQKGFPDCSIVRSSDTMIEIMEHGVSKGIAIRRYCAINGICVNNTIAFGDHYNDYEMLKTVGSGYLMGNAPAALKVLIPNVIGDNDHDGIYYALRGQGLFTSTAI